MSTLREINEILKRLNSTTIKPEKTLQECTLHPAGYITFFSMLDNRFGAFPWDVVRDMDLPNLTGADLLEMIDDALDAA